MFHSAFFTERRGLASYAAAQRELGRGAASLVDKILKGAKPAALAVRQPVPPFLPQSDHEEFCRLLGSTSLTREAVTSRAGFRR